MRKAVIRESDGFVENVIEIKSGAKWQPPEGCYLIAAGKGSPGDTWNGEEFIKPPPPPEPEPPRSTHPARIVSFDPDSKILQVVRTYEGKEYTYDCEFFTQNLVDEYQAGKLAIGDHILVHFDDSGRRVAMMKIFQNW